jgi:hypothetical protein
MTNEKQSSNVTLPDLTAFESWIGQQVVKKSKKPFKSKSTVGTVKGVMVHPITSRAAFTFNEDDSYVECQRCILK